MASTEVAPLAYVASLALATFVMSHIPPVRRAMDSICSPDLETPPPPPSDFQHAADQTMENSGDTVPSILDFQTAPIKSYQTEQVDGAPQDRFSRQLPRVPHEV
jgi:hypothetical protein